RTARCKAGAIACRSNSRAWIAAKRASFQLIGHLGEAGHGALLVAFAPRPADADRADRFLTDLDRNAAAQRDNIGQFTLPRERRHVARALPPFRRGAAEGARRVGLAARQFEIVRARLVT